MDIEIRKYDSAQHDERVLQLIESEGEEWKDYLTPTYKETLKRSITYVAFADQVLCGYSRSINDHGYYIWVIDLLVHQQYRGHSIGKKLLECIHPDFPEQEVFVLSDVDEYYQKQGYSKEGSIFKIK